MKYGYVLSKNDIVALGLIPLSAEKYYAEQNGFSCSFQDIHEIIEREEGLFKGDILIKGNELSDVQQTYIIKNVKCEEF